MVGCYRFDYDWFLGLERKWTGLGSVDGLENRGRVCCNIRSGLVAGLENRGGLGCYIDLGLVLH